jgi:hypothetical protein
MESRLEIILNKVLKEHKELLYGKDSDIIVERIEWIRSEKCYKINLTILTTEIKDSLEIHPDGINTMVDIGWPILGKEKKIIVISSLDVK